MEKKHLSKATCLIGFLIIFLVIYHLYQDRKIETWQDSALLTEKVPAKQFKLEKGPYECSCKCQIKCPEKTKAKKNKTKTEKAEKEKKSDKGGYRISYYPWYVKKSDT